MRISDLAGKNVVIWGAGLEGQAAFEYLSVRLPGLTLAIIDENPSPSSSVAARADATVRDPARIRQLLSRADVVVKSPGVSLYHPLIEELRPRGLAVTSLLDLWFANDRTGVVIGVTGTKGKSTTSTLLNHILNELGKRSIVVGNIGVPITQASATTIDFLVVEVSSYQAASFSGECDLGVLTCLFPEHLDWHRSEAAYYRDKSNLLTRSRTRIVSSQAAAILQRFGMQLGTCRVFDTPEGLHIRDHREVYVADRLIGEMNNDFLSKEHNRLNVSAALSVVDTLGLSLPDALLAMGTYRGLPHRQQEIGTAEGILFVNDSMSTIPQATIAALKAYAGRWRTVIVGGYDRGVDSSVLREFILGGGAEAVVCIGATGRQLREALRAGGMVGVHVASSMKEAVDVAKARTPTGGVVLLSPGASSFGMFRDYVHRATAFASAAGLANG